MAEPAAAHWQRPEAVKAGAHLRRVELEHTDVLPSVGEPRGPGSSRRVTSGRAEVEEHWLEHALCGRRQDHEW